MKLTRRTLGVYGGALLAAGAAAPAATARAAASQPADDGFALVDPELRPIAQIFSKSVGPFPKLGPDTLARARAMVEQFTPQPLPTIPYIKQQIPRLRGDAGVTAYVINAKSGSQRPGILHTHGGGFVSGSARGNLRRLQELAEALDATIVSVDYRLAPETRFSGSIEDNYAGLKWMYDHAAEIGVDPRRIALMGDSAGGGHAAILAITARDRGEVPVRFQCLIYPMLDDRTGSTRPVPSHGKFLWTAEDNRFGWRSFLGQEPGGDRVPVAAVPARCNDLGGLPPAFIGVGSIDLFVDEDIGYAQRLIDTGVPTQLMVVPGAFHGFDAVASQAKIAKQFTEATLAALRKAFAV